MEVSIAVAQKTETSTQFVGTIVMIVYYTGSVNNTISTYRKSFQVLTDPEYGPYSTNAPFV